MSDLCPAALDADGAGEQAHAVLLGGEHVLDGGADLRAGRIGSLTLGVKWFAQCPAEVDFRHQPSAQDGPLILPTAVGRIRPDCAAGVVRVDQLRQFPAILSGGIAGRPGADEPMTLIDPDVRFVAEHRRGDLGHELAICPFLPTPAL